MSLEEFLEVSLRAEEGSTEMFNLKKRLLKRVTTDLDSQERDESEPVSYTHLTLPTTPYV